MREYIRFSRHKVIHGIVAELFNMLETVLIVLFCMILLFTYVLDVAVVQGSSMVPTLENEDKLLITMWHGELEYSDIIIVDAGEAILMNEDGTLYTAEGLEKTIVKRVIAVGGQTLDIDFESGAVYLDGETLSEDYVNTLTTTPANGGAFSYPVTIPEGYVFVMGDNRDVSKDSRYADVGLIPVSDVIGKVILRLSPWEKFGLV